MGIMLPEYSNSILNLSASIMNTYGLLSDHTSLPLVDECLKQSKKNLIFLTLDGLGSSFLRQQMPRSCFLNEHYHSDLTSVYPCTTTAATTTLQSGLSPAQHGWLGWNAWFMEYGAIVDLFLDRDSLSGAAIKPSPAEHYLKYKTIIDRITEKSQQSDLCRTVMPPFASNGVNSFEQMVERIITYCQEPGQRFISAYWYEPDTLMHKYGPASPEVIIEMTSIDNCLEKMFDQVSDSILIITADHGQTAIEEEFFLDDIPEIMNCLLIPPTLENRAASFFIKHSCRNTFEEMFIQFFEYDHMLFERQQVYDMGLFGPGKKHPKVDDFLGDYLACATGKRMMRYIGAHDRERYFFKGHHAGLTEEEMVVPLIIASC